MQTTWDLTPLYPSIESEAFLADLSAVQSSIQEMTAWSRTSFQGPDPTTDLCTYLAFCKETGSRFFRLKSYCNLLLSTDGLATAPGAALEKLEQLEALFAPIDTAAKAFLATVPDLTAFVKTNRCFWSTVFSSPSCKKKAAICSPPRKKPSMPPSAPPACFLS